MAGVLLVIMGVARLGGLIQFVPYPVTTGFTAGIAVVIATLQLKDFLGLTRARRCPSTTSSKVGALAGPCPPCAGRTSPSALFTLAVLLALAAGHPQGARAADRPRPRRRRWPRCSRRCVPGFEVATILSRFQRRHPAAAAAAGPPLAPAGAGRQAARPLLRADPRADPLGLRHRHAGRHRVAPLGGGGGRHDRRLARSRRRAGGAGRGQHRGPVLRRHRRHRRPRPHGDQHPLGRALAARRDLPLALRAGWRCCSWRPSSTTCRWPRSPRCC